MVKNLYLKFLFALPFFLFVDRFGSVENCQLLIIRRVYSPKAVWIYRNFAEIMGLEKCYNFRPDENIRLSREAVMHKKAKKL